MRSLFGIPLPERKGMKTGGQAVPRKTVIANQPHQLAYINPQEEQMLLDAGGTGQPGPGGIPAYPDKSVNPTGGSKKKSTTKFTSNYRSPDRDSTAEDKQRAANARAKAAYVASQAIKDAPTAERGRNARRNENRNTGSQKKINILDNRTTGMYGTAGEDGKYVQLGGGVKGKVGDIPTRSEADKAEQARRSSAAQPDAPYLNHITRGDYKDRYTTEDGGILSTIKDTYMNLGKDFYAEGKLALADSFGGEQGFKNSLLSDYPSLTEEQLSSAYKEFETTTLENRAAQRKEDTEAPGKRAAAREGDARDPVTGRRIRDLDFECPEGYTFNEAEQRCEIVASVGSGIPTRGGSFPELTNSGATTGVPVVNTQYTQFAAPTLAGLPAAAPNGFVMPMMNTQPITIAQQTPQGLAGLQQQIQRNAGMQTG